MNYSACSIQRVLVAGGTGLVGRHLLEYLTTQGMEIRILSRSGSKAGTKAFSWDELPKALDGIDAVINLAGENIGDHRWTSRRKHSLRESRLDTTIRLVKAIRESHPRPQVLMNASAVGIYGGRDEVLLDETASPGSGFLAELCRDWEAAAENVQALGVRLVKLRLGVVLARDGGALPRMSLPIQSFAGCKLGSGLQGLSWIHIGDLLALILEALRNPGFAGAINATSPCPVSQGSFSRALARQLHRPIWPVPAFVTAAALELFLGEMARELLLQGAFVKPRKAMDLGFHFDFPELEAALSDLIKPIRL